MAFPPSFLDELIARNPIEDVVGQYVSLKRSGSNLFGLCPFHGEKTASFSVSPDKGIYCSRSSSKYPFLFLPIRVFTTASAATKAVALSTS